MTTFYIIDGAAIINAVECSTKAQAEQVAGGMIRGAYLRVEEHPSMEMLKRYRYWNERP